MLVGGVRERRGAGVRSEAPPPRLQRRRPTLPPPSRPQALRPTAGPFPEGWPSLPSTREMVETPPALIDPAELDDCVAIAGGPGERGGRGAGGR